MKHTILVAAVFAVLAWAYYNFTQREPGQTTVTDSAMKMEIPKKPEGKPICSSAQVPAGDCTPLALAYLPPDPGEAGKLTKEGIDSNKNGIRDDIDIWLAFTWGHSQRAMAVLTPAAKSLQQQVVLGGDISAEAAAKMFPELMNMNACYVYGETTEMMHAQAFETLKMKTRNTPERYLRLWAFSDLFGHRAFTDRINDISSATDACGFDPEALPN